MLQLWAETSQRLRRYALCAVLAFVSRSLILRSLKSRALERGVDDVFASWKVKQLPAQCDQERNVIVAICGQEIVEHSQQRSDLCYGPRHDICLLYLLNLPLIDRLQTDVLDHPAAPNPVWSGDSPDPATSPAPYRVYNIGNRTPVEVNTVIALIEHELGRKAEKVMRDAEPGDMAATCADVEDLARDIGFSPATPLAEGIRRFVAWYRDYHRG